MKKLMIAALAIASVMFASVGVASAQDPVQGTVVSDPATVPSAGEHTVTASGSGFIPESTILLGSCTSPGDTLVPGVSTDEEIAAEGGSIDPLQHCDLATALQITTDADGNFSEEVTATIGENFWLSGGALDGSQAGGVWIPIVAAAADADAEAAELAVTGVDSADIALAGFALLAAGGAALVASRREDLA